MKKSLLVFSLVFFAALGAFAQGAQENSLSIAPRSKSIPDDFFFDSNTTQRKDYYLVVNVFDKRSKAQHYVDRLKKKGLQAAIEAVGSDIYFVHIPDYRTSSITYDIIVNVRQEFNDAWFQRLDLYDSRVTASVEP